MSNPEQYDVLVFGSGEAGKYLAWHLAKSGQRCAVIERKYIGGSCPNIACLPSKNIIHSAKVASYFRRAEEFGIGVDNWKIDMPGVRGRKRKMVDDLVAMHVRKYKASGAELVMGEGGFIAPKTIQVALADGGMRVLRGQRVIISTGSRATIEPLPGLTESQPLTHIEAMELDEVPTHLIVLGGGYIGLELGQAIRRFGSRVTLVDRNDRLAHQEDHDISQALQRLCLDEGMELCLSASVMKVEGRSGEGVKVHLMQGGAPVVIEGSHLLVASGRTPNTDQIGLELAGVETTAKGHVKVNERLETTAADVWAVGDCAGSPHFTHIAFDDFRIIRDNLAGGHRSTTGRLVPFCMFTDPELARLGLSEADAKRQNIPYRLGKIPIDQILRAQTLSETRGFMKALIDVTSDRILGFAAFGVGAADFLPPVQLAMSAGLPFTALRDMILTHPTMAEGFVPLFSAVPGRE